MNERERRSSIAYAPLCTAGKKAGETGKRLLTLGTRLGRAAKARAVNNWDKVTVSVSKACLPFLRSIRPVARQSSPEKRSRDDNECI